MRVRRAALLIAIVLGLAALASSLAPDPARQRPQPSPTPTIAPPSRGRPPGPDAVTLRFGAAGTRTRRVRSGAHTIVRVEVDRAGQVALEGLGLVAAADPRTPAVFDLLAEEPGRFDVVFTPVDGDSRALGTILVLDGAG